LSLDFGHGFKPKTLPHKPLIFLNASIVALLKAQIFGREPLNCLYDISTEIKLTISSRLEISHEILLCERFNVSRLFNSLSIDGIVPLKSSC